MPEWKDTVNLPRTGFPMKASLPTTEPEALARWAAMDLYGRIQARRKDAPTIAELVERFLEAARAVRERETELVRAIEHPDLG